VSTSRFLGGRLFSGQAWNCLGNEEISAVHPAAGQHLIQKRPAAPTTAGHAGLLAAWGFANEHHTCDGRTLPRTAWSRVACNGHCTQMRSVWAVLPVSRLPVSWHASLPPTAASPDSPRRNSGRDTPFCLSVLNVKVRGLVLLATQSYTGPGLLLELCRKICTIIWALYHVEAC